MDVRNQVYTFYYRHVYPRVLSCICVYLVTAMHV